MLSYQHGFHAGNFADVIKHIMLANILNYMKQKEKPLCYVDTHAGRGAYDLAGREAQKNREYMNGIGKLLERADLPECVSGYVDLVRQQNPDRQLLFYPGSPLFAAQLLGPQDRLFFYERHPQEFRQLQDIFKSDKRTKMVVGDGFKDTLGLLPPKERRGLVFIDPPYELKGDYQEAVRTIQAFYRRFASGCFVLWYPVVSRIATRALEKALHIAGMGEILLLELSVKPDSPEFGMTACGMAVVNPPWTLCSQMEDVLPYLAEVLGDSGKGGYRIETRGAK